MTEKITRKDFLRLAAAATSSAALAGYAGRGAAQNTEVSAGPVVSDNQADTLIRGADVLTMDPELGERLATDVLISNGRIEAIGTGLPADGAEVIDAQGMILMPGMIDGHRHVWQTIALGRMVESNPGDFARDYIFWKMAAVVAMEPEDHYIAELVGGLQAIDSGVTSILDYAHGQDTEANAMAAARGLRDSGIAGWFGYQLAISYPFDVGDTVSPAEMLEALFAARPTEEEWNTASRLRNDLFDDPSALLQPALGPPMWPGYAMDDIRDYMARARSIGVDLIIAHLHKPATPHPEGFMGHRDSGIPDLHEAGLLGPDFHAAHANRLTPEELTMMRDTGGMIAATTMSEYSFMMDPHRGAPVHGRARAAGVPVGIGADVPMGLTGDYFEHVRSSLWSHYLEEESRQIVQGYRSQDTLDFATALGAKAIRLGDETGSITTGKRADLVLLNTDRIGFGTMGTLADRVVTFARTTDIDSVWIAGQARKRHGEMIDVDWASLKARLHEAQQRVEQKVATVKWV